MSDVGHQYKQDQLEDAKISKQDAHRAERIALALLLAVAVWGRRAAAFYKDGPH